MNCLSNFQCDLFADYIEGNASTAKETSFNFNEDEELQEITDYRNNSLHQHALVLHKAYPINKKMAWASFSAFARAYAPSLVKESNGWEEIKTIFESAGKSRIANEARQKQGIKKDLVLLDSKEILNHKVEPIQWKIQHSLPKGGIVGLCGDAGVGKTFLAIQKSICLLNGKKFLGKYEVEKGSVCYVNVDMPFAVFQHRAKLLGLQEDMRFYTFVKRQFSIEEYGDEFLNLASELKPDLIVFDILSRIHNKDENSVKDMKYVFDFFTQLTEMGSSVLFLHHIGKGTPFYRGSTVIRASADVMLMMDKVKDCKFKNEYTIKFDKVRLEAETEVKDVKVRLINKNGILEFEEICELSSEDNADEKPNKTHKTRTTKESAQNFIISLLIKDKLSEVDGTSLATILGEATIQNLNPRAVQRELQALVRDERVARRKKGDNWFYSLVDDKPEPSSN